MSKITLVEQGVDPPAPATNRVTFYAKANGIYYIDDLGVVTFVGTGPTGAPGTPGVDGSDGADGLPGSPGAAGAAGATGLQGVGGLIGMDGIDGEQGFPGVQGVQGIQGVQGPMGPAGQDGEMGPEGPQGVPGQGLGPLGFLFLEAGTFDVPVSSDWPVTALAQLTPSTVNSGVLERRADDTTEEALGGWTMPILKNAVRITLRSESHAQTAPAGARTVGVKLYYRRRIESTAFSAWSSLVLNDINMTTNVNPHYQEQTILLTTLGALVGESVQFLLTRINPVAGTELVGDWCLTNLTVLLDA